MSKPKISPWSLAAHTAGAVTQAMLWDMGFVKGQELTKTQRNKVRIEANKILRLMGVDTIDDEYILDVTGFGYSTVFGS